jgi:ABC-2 type transport system permease protein
VFRVVTFTDPLTVAPGAKPRAASPSLVRLARLGIELRWRLVDNRARRLGKRTRGFAVVFGALYALGTIAALVAARSATDDVAQATLVLAASSLASGWIFGPILLGGVDETVDPTRLALLPLERRELFVVQLGAALSGIGPASALVGFGVGIPLGFATASPLALLTLLAAPAMIAMTIGLARSTAALLAIAQRSRIGRDLAVLLAALSAGALFVVAQLATSVSGSRAAGLIDALAWAPWCWPGRAVLAAGADDAGAALGWTALSLVSAAAALTLWAALSQFLLTNGERVVRVGRRGDGAALGRADSVFGAALARQWISVRRSPNTRVALVFGIAFGVAFPVLQILQHGAEGSSLVAFSALLAMLANIGATSNLLGFDAGSLWIEALCNGPGRAHMAARSLAALPNLLIPTWLSGVVVGVWTDQWAAVALVSAIAVPIALIVLSQGLVTSILAPWPLSDGDNPFGNRQGAEGRGGRLAATALSGLGAALVLSTPIIVAAYAGREAWWGWLVPLVATAWAVAIGAATLRWVGRRLAGSEPELLELLSPRAMT